MKNIYRIKGILSAVIVLSAVVIGIIASYPFIQRNYDKIIDDTRAQEEIINQQRNEDLKNNFVDLLFRSNYSLYADMVQQNEGKTMLPSQIFLPAYSAGLEDNRSSNGKYMGNGGEIQEDETYREYAEETYVSDNNQILVNQEDIDNNINNFDSIIENWHSEFYNSYINEYELEYYIIDNQSKNYLTNTISPLNKLLEQDASATELKNSYSFYAVFQYDNKGGLEIPVFYGLSQDKRDLFITRELTKQLIKEAGDSYNWYQYGNQIKGPSDVTIIYGVKAEDFYHGGRNYYTDYYGERTAFERGGFIQIFCIAMVILLLAAIILPLRKSWGLREVAGKIPGEISIFGIFVPFMFYESFIEMAKETVRGSFLDLSDLLISEKLERILDYGFNYLVWMVILGISLFCLISFFQLFTLGIKKYMAEKTICGKCFMKLKAFLITLKDIDLTDSSNKAIIKILAVNFVILAILCSIWVVGIFVLLIYSVILFFIIKKYVTNLKQQYQELLNVTSKMAEGNLEAVVEIEKDLGIFNPLKEELNKVQFGFKKAVDEEMKSQKMKTELISNVSHDLKTPLTAIITYVNLLKDENITEEERNSYIDTLDKKSMRLKRIIEDLFEMSKANSDNIQLNLVEVDIVSLIKQVQLEMADKISESGIDFRNRFSREKIVLKLDSEKTYRVFENLIINITKYALADTRAYVELTEDETQVYISLKNISATELDFMPDEITERFTRGDKSRNTEGSGLGLAIVKSFVELQGGKMEILLDGDLFKVNIRFHKNKDYSSEDSKELQEN